MYGYGRNRDLHRGQNLPGRKRKQKHAMRYTQYRGLTQVTNWVKLKFAAMNLKKLARWLWKENSPSFLSRLVLLLYAGNPACSYR